MNITTKITKEIYLRHIYTLTTFIITFITCYENAYELIYLIVKPLQSFLEQTQNIKTIHFIFTDITEAFQTHLKISLVFSIFFTIIYYLIQVINFLTPALYNKHYRQLKFWFKFWFIIFNCLILILYQIILPILWNFFLSFETNSKYQIFTIALHAKILDYINLSLTIIYNFNFLLIILLILNINIYYYKQIKIKHLVQFRKYIYILILCISALISPPDIFSQILFSIPIILGYESTILCFFIQKEIKKKYNNFGGDRI
jgi:sec-independent protein translocase protein TatC